MAIDLPELPYALNALEPHISLQTLSLHHGKHHVGYVKKLNELIDGTEFANMSLEEIVKATAKAKDKKHVTIFNNAAQAWNHCFLWRSMEAGAAGTASRAVAARIKADFGGPEKFEEEFKKAAMGQFGSGWAWLVDKGRKLEVVTTSNAATPFADESLGKPLCVLDVWEHAYYVDYQNKRDEYIEAFLKHLINWRFVDANLAAENVSLAA
jgi:Fe-Mn family superoxide dismutase